MHDCFPSSQVCQEGPVECFHIQLAEQLPHMNINYEATRLLNSQLCCVLCAAGARQPSAGASGVRTELGGAGLNRQNLHSVCQV